MVSSALMAPEGQQVSARVVGQRQPGEVVLFDEPQPRAPALARQEPVVAVRERGAQGRGGKGRLLGALTVPPYSLPQTPDPLEGEQVEGRAALAHEEAQGGAQGEPEGVLGAGRRLLGGPGDLEELPGEALE
jgi:hypothetical protein